MPSFVVKNQEGEEFDFDPVEYAVSQDPSLKNAKITEYDTRNKRIKASLGDEELELDVNELVSGLGLEMIGGAGDAPQTALDQSPLSITDRMRLGLNSSESAEVKRVLDAATNAGSSPELDAKAEANQGKALRMLKSKFEDARIVDGEYVVKKDGVWHKADAPGLDSGDVAQFAAQNGLNIVGGILGGILSAPSALVAGPAGPAAGSVAGSALAEGAEELLRYAIERDQLDVGGTAQDIALEGVMGLVSAAGGKAIQAGAPMLAKGAKAITPEFVEEASLNAVKSLKGFASQASDGVKDLVSSVFGNLGPKMAPAPLREMIDSPENVQTALSFGRQSLTEEGKSAIQNRMVTTLRDGLNVIREGNQTRFGEVVEQLASKADDSIELDLDDTLQQLELMLKGASPEKRNFLDPVITKTRELIEKVSPGRGKGPKLITEQFSLGTFEPKKRAVLRGAAAVRAMHSLKISAAEKLNKIMARPSVVDSLTDADTLHTASVMEDFLDNKIWSTAKQLGMDETVADARKLYGATKDALRPIISKAFSEKQPIAQVARIAREEAGDDAADAFVKLNQLYPEGKMPAIRSQLRLMQAGIEVGPKVLMTKEGAKQAAISVGGGTALGVPGLGLVGGAVSISPRFTAFAARNLTTSGGAAQTVAKAAGLGAQGAEVGAKMLTRLAASSGFLQSLPRAQAQTMLRDPEAFRQWLTLTNEFIGSSERDTEENLTNAAIKQVQGQ